MKKTIIFIGLFFLSSAFVMGQTSQIGHDVTIFSADGLKFSVMFNGVPINQEPASSVVATDVQTDWVKALITFEDASIPAIKKNILQIKGPNNKTNYPETVVYEIVNKKGEYTLKWSSTSPKKIQQQQTVIIQQQAPQEPKSNIQINTPNGTQIKVNVPK